MAFDAISRGLVHTISYADLSPMIEHATIIDDRKLKDRILANEAIVKNLRYHDLDVYEFISKSTVFFNSMVYARLLEINKLYNICHKDQIIQIMAETQRILSFLVQATTAKSEAAIAAVAREKFLS